MFAVVILGIGAIMVAAILPVAISQTQQAVDQTIAATVAQNARAHLSTTLRADNVPIELAAVQPIASLPFVGAAVRGNQIHSADPRYAWTALCRRENNLKFTEVFIWVVRLHNRERYTSADFSGAPGSLQPRSLLVRLENRIAEADQVRFSSVAGATDPSLQAIAPGCFVVVATDPNEGRAVGRRYRVGEAIDRPSGLWALMPGADLQSDDENVTDGTAFVIGRAWADPDDPSKGCEGPAQDLLLFHTLIALPPTPAAPLMPPP